MQHTTEQPLHLLQRARADLMEAQRCSHSWRKVMEAVREADQRLAKLQGALRKSTA